MHVNENTVFGSTLGFLLLLLALFYQHLVVICFN